MLYPSYCPGPRQLGNGTGPSRALTVAAFLVALSLVLVRPAGAQTGGVLTVTNTNDTGPGSLRQAILDSNATAGTQTIAFQIPGGGVHSIVPASILPTLTDPVVIDGYTQPGSSPNTLAEGSNAIILIELVGPGAGGSGLRLSGGNSLVRGLVINRFFNAPAVNIVGGSNTRVEGCFLGTDANGTGKFADQSREGVSISSSAGNTVGGVTPDKRNVISGHRLNGVNIFGTGVGNNVVEGNLIGVDKTGTAALGNGQNGISISGFTGNVIGGATAASRNVISANNTGIQLFTGSNVVQGNYIGTDVTGANDLGNSGTGFFMQGGANNLVGGPAVAPGRAPGNVISGNGGAGIDINGNAAPGHTLQGNIVGLNAAGTAALPNGADGIAIRNTGGGNLVGDPDGTRGRNIISGNLQHGITINNDGNRLINNYVGAAADGATAAGNSRAGVLINSRNDNSLRNNVIAFNGEDGVAVNYFQSGTGNALLSNSIFSNAGLGIDLGNNGLTPNDAGDADVGANNLQNFPVIASAAGSATGTLVQGGLNTDPNAQFTVEFFSGPSCDPSGNGEGQTFLGSTAVTTDASGAATFRILLPAAVLAGHSVTATATSAVNNTSELSPCAFATTLAGAGISGRVSDAGGGPLAGITVTLSGSQTRVAQTDAGGNYSFPELTPGGDYTVAASSPYYAFGARRGFPGLAGSQVADFQAQPAPPGGAPLTSDSFDAPERDAAKWNLGTLTHPPGAFDSLVSVSQQTGQLVITPRANVSGPHYNGYVSVNSFDLTGGHISVEVPEVAKNGAETIFSIGTGPDDYFRFVARGAGTAGAAKAFGAGPLNASAQLVLVFEVRVGGVLSPAPPASVPYDPVLHRFWRFRHDAPANSIVFETSPDNATYTERFRRTLARSVSALACELSAGTAQPVADPGQARFDNLSLVTAAAQFSAADFTASEGEGRVTVTVTRSGNVAGAATLTYRSEDADAFTVGCADAAGAAGNAYARCDFATTVGTLQFAAGETTKTFAVPVIDDAHAEGAETFQLRLVNSMGAALGAPALVRVTITDNDSAGAANPVVSSFPFFVRQQYLDFLSREPDQAGFNAWLGVLQGCANPNTGPEVPSGCDRIHVSGEGFFRSQEFQLKGGYVFRFYKAAYNRLPEYLEITSDMSFVAGQTAEEVFARRAELAALFAGRQEFRSAYGAMTNAQYVAALLGRYNLQQVTAPDPAQPDGAARVTLTQSELITRLDAGTLTRAQVLRAVADSDQVTAAEFDNAFVAVQYYGYLRRKPEPAGYEAWLRVLRSGDTRTMVNGFLNSAEYKLRFGHP